MRKVFVVLVAALMVQTAANAQIRAGVKLGTSFADINLKEAIDLDTLVVRAEDSGFGIHLGGFVRIPFGPIYVEASPMLGSAKVDYTIDDFRNGQQLVGELKTESFLKLDLPILVGLKVLKIGRVQAGPVGSITLVGTDELASIEGLENTWDGMTWGFQAGAGLDLGKLQVDVNYEGALSDYGHNFTIGGSDFEFDARRSRVMITLAYNLINK